MNATPPTLQEKIALAVSGTILLVTTLYWVVQIHGVIEMLRLAYG